MPRNRYSSVTLPTHLIKDAKKVLKTGPGSRYHSLAELVSDALEERLNQLRGVEMVSVAEVSREEAIRLVTEYLEKNPGAHYPSDIANTLGLDLELVFEITTRLLREHIVELGTEKELVAH